MDAQHTPGPWHAIPPNTGENHFYNWIVGSDAPPARGSNCKTLVACVREQATPILNASAHCEADAKLIAAAPDLLAAAKAVIKAAAAYKEAYCGEHPSNFRGAEAQAMANKAMEDLRAAIDRAEAPR